MMELPGWLVTASLWLLALVLLSPYLLLLYLRVKLRSVHFRGRVWGLLSLTGLTFQSNQSHIGLQIESIQLGYSQGKVILQVTGIEVDLTRLELIAGEAPARQAQGGLFALLIRILLLFILQYVELRVSVLTVYLPGVSLSTELLRFTLKIDNIVSVI
jgi:hypothetical protein